MPWFSAKARKKESLGVGGGHEKMDLSTNLLLLLLGKLSTPTLNFYSSASTLLRVWMCGQFGGTIGRGCGRLVMDLGSPQTQPLCI
jgi:hypothetical protein